MPKLSAPFCTQRYLKSCNLLLTVQLIRYIISM
nr:MAG TPA: hypothetical protein [Caudoviricetes sp.]